MRASAGKKDSTVVVFVALLTMAGGCSSSNGGSAGTGGHAGAAAGANGAAGTSATGRGGTTSAGGTIGTGGTAGSSAGAGRGGTTGSAGATGTGGAAGGSAALPDLGKACSSNAECTGGTTCLMASSKIINGTEGPANGYCSKTCTQNTDCSDGGVCLDVSAAGANPLGYCFQTCTFGGAAGSSKCHGRMDVGCLTIQSADTTTTPATPQIDICYPVCSQDSDCPGRKCDLASALCADTASPGDPLGAHCTIDPDAGTSSCAGGCLPIGSAAGGTAIAATFCTNYCVVGNLNSCNWVGAGTSLTSGGTHGVCALASGNAQVGDIGYCTQECDTATDCSDKTDPGVSCDTSVMSTVGHGFCSWN